MAILWTVEVLAVGRENLEVVEFGAADTEPLARAAATAALLTSAWELGRHEFWVTVGGAVMMVVPGLDYVGEVDIARLRDALGPPPAAQTVLRPDL